MSAGAPAPPPPEVVGATFIKFTGPVFVGSILTWGLFGVLCVQMYTFATSGRKEKPWMKALVWGVFAVDIAQILTSTRWVWKMLVKHWGDTTVITSTLVFEDAGDVFSIPIAHGLISGAVELFLAWRIYALSKNIIARICCGIIVIASIMASTAAFYISGVTIVKGGTAATIIGLHVAVTVWSVGLFVSDVLIALTLTVILWKRRQHTNTVTLRHTDKLIDKIITLTLETGMVTALVSPIHLGLYYGITDNYIHLTTDMLVAKLYSNVLLVTLNSRGPGKPAVYTGSDFVSLSTAARTGPRPGVINVETEVYQAQSTTAGNYSEGDMEMKKPHFGTGNSTA